MPNATRIRRAMMGDLAALIDLGERYCVADGAQRDSDRAEAAFTPLLVDDRHGVVLVVEVDERVIGYAVLTWGWSIEAGGREALIDEMYVDRPGRGYGSLLIEAVMDSAAAAGAARVFLETESANAEARTFWLTRGFELEDSIWLQRRCNPGGGKAD